MTRTVSATISTAVAEETTRPIYLLRMAWDTEVRAATWGANLSWNSETWVASGIRITSLDTNGGTMDMPMGDTDPWFALAMDEIPRGRAISIYEYHTNFTVSPNASDAVLVFTGVMDEFTASDSIRVRLIESATNKVFPFTSIDRPTYTHFLPSGTRLTLGTDTIVVQ